MEAVFTDICMFEELLVHEGLWPKVLDRLHIGLPCIVFVMSLCLCMCQPNFCFSQYGRSAFYTLHTISNLWEALFSSGYDEDNCKAIVLSKAELA